MTDEEFSATPDPSPELAGSSEPCLRGSSYHHDGQKHQDPEKIRGHAQKIQNNPEQHWAFWLQRTSCLSHANLRFYL